MEKQFRDIYRTFIESITSADKPLHDAALAAFNGIFEGTNTAQAIKEIQNKVGSNDLATEGDGIFDLSDKAGFEGDKTADQQIDDAITSGLTSGELDDFGTALSTETPPTEGDFGFDNASTTTAFPDDDAELPDDEDYASADGDEDYAIAPNPDEYSEDEESDPYRTPEPPPSDIDAEWGNDPLQDEPFGEAIHLQGKALTESVNPDEIDTWAKSWISILNAALHSGDIGGAMAHDVLKATLMRIDEIIKTNPVLEENNVKSMKDFDRISFDHTNKGLEHAFSLATAFKSEILKEIRLFPYSDVTDDSDPKFHELLNTITAMTLKLVAAIGNFTKLL